MLRLSLAPEPYWLDLPQSVRVQVRPLTAAVMGAAQSYAERIIRERILQQAEILGFGAPIDGPDYRDTDVRAGAVSEELAVGLARFGIIAWEGVGDEAGTPLPLSDAARAAFGRSELSGEFLKAYSAPLRQVDAEGNASAPVPNGSSVLGATTADVAPTPAPTALVH